MKDEFDLWWESATPETLTKARERILEKGNAFIRQNLEAGDPRMEKAIYRIFFERHRDERVHATLKTDADREKYLRRLHREPHGWKSEGNHWTKYDSVTRTVLRRTTPPPQEPPWSIDDIPD